MILNFPDLRGLRVEISKQCSEEFKEMYFVILMFIRRVLTIPQQSQEGSGVTGRVGGGGGHVPLSPVFVRRQMNQASMFSLA